jgi:hypothetical protein
MSAEPARSESSADVTMWLDELDRFDDALTSHELLLAEIEAGGNGPSPAPFVGSTRLPEFPPELSAYARRLIERHRAITHRATGLSERLRPPTPRPASHREPIRGTILERQA